jgi:hypothetical protein
MKSKLLVLAAFFFSVRADAEERNPIRSITLDTGYFQHSARAFWRFGQEVDGAVSVGFDALSEGVGSSALARLLIGGAFYWGWNRLEYGFFVANHELGHGQRFYSVGGTPRYTWQGSGVSQANALALWAQGFTQYNNGAYTSSGANLRYAPPDIAFIISAAGMNNSNQYAESIEDQITYGGGGHILQYVGYARAKEDGAEYVKRSIPGREGDDVQDTLRALNAKGYGISTSDIRTGSLVAHWASSTNWLFFLGALRYALHGDPIVKGAYLGSIKLPDISHYLSTRGASYVIRSGLNLGDVFIPMNLEYVYKGQQVAEATLGWRTLKDKSPNTLGLNVTLNSDAGYGLSGDISRGLSSQSELGFGASYYSQKSILGERLIHHYAAGGTSGYDLWARVSAKY